MKKASDSSKGIVSLDKKNGKAAIRKGQQPGEGGGFLWKKNKVSRSRLSEHPRVTKKSEQGEKIGGGAGRNRRGKVRLTT